MTTDRPTTTRSTIAWVGLGFRVILALVLLAAGGLKVADPSESVRAVRAYEVLPEAIVPLVGYGLPLLEIVLGGFLLIGFSIRFAAISSAFLLLAFMIGIAQAAARGLTIDCGCFGGGGQVSARNTAYLTEFIRDALLLFCALFLIRWPNTRFALDP